MDEKGLEALDGVTAATGPKTHFVFVDFADGKYEIRTRQHDGSTGFVTPFVRKQVHGTAGSSPGWPGWPSPRTSGRSVRSTRPGRRWASSSRPASRARSTSSSRRATCSPSCKSARPARRSRRRRARKARRRTRPRPGPDGDAGRRLALTRRRHAAERAVRVQGVQPLPRAAAAGRADGRVPVREARDRRGRPPAATDGRGRHAVPGRHAPAAGWDDRLPGSDEPARPGGDALRGWRVHLQGAVPQHRVRAGSQRGHGGRPAAGRDLSGPIGRPDGST